MVDRSSPEYVHQLEVELTSMHAVVQGLKDILRTRSDTVSGRTAALEQVLQAARSVVKRLASPTARQVGALDVKALEQAIRLADALPP